MIWKSGAAVVAISWIGLWMTGDQHGDRLMRAEKFADAAVVYNDPMRQGVAWYRAGEFEKATQSFARVATPEAQFNQGNCWVMLGKYDKAVASYDQAIKQRPDWTQALENRDLAAARAKMLELKGGDLGDQQVGADEIVFDKKKDDQGQETEIAGDQAASDATVQAVWLRQVQTKPADFLRSKFAFQQAEQDAGGTQ
ncbi:Tetratricopeptide repeat protein [Rosistilla carotiformis]|uniref:Tetratricopeptide repeat protein n=1 Tax=Rosistilla carotiformis TaxID=2528017 RepID=A0A518K213_9BACT|nr:tetratricopeptide repeat protein [Rosistilla carotiformis]QDV71809.1 Tetratricopeptide repeat protein [Rosistilla carotiformis]